jgi:hypothetical protein
MSIIEAMACGRPVVASDSGGNAEYVEHGVTGLLFAPGNPVDLGEKLAALLGDPERCRAMGIAARRRAIDLLSGAAHYDQILRAYLAALEKAPFKKG